MEHAHTQCSAPACCVREIGRVCVWVWASMHPRRTVRARSVGVDRGWLGAQALGYASAFNANIGAWNTAAVTTLSGVCAALSGPGDAPSQAGRARRVVDVGRAVVRGGDRRCACAGVCADVSANACTGVHV